MSEWNTTHLSVVPMFLLPKNHVNLVSTSMNVRSIKKTSVSKPDFLQYWVLVHLSEELTSVKERLDHESGNEQPHTVAKLPTTPLATMPCTIAGHTPE